MKNETFVPKYDGHGLGMHEKESHRSSYRAHRRRRGRNILAPYWVGAGALCNSSQGQEFEMTLSRMTTSLHFPAIASSR